MNRNIKVLKNALDLFKSYLDTYATDNQDFFYHQASIEALADIEKCDPARDLLETDDGKWDGTIKALWRRLQGRHPSAEFWNLSEIPDDEMYIFRAHFATALLASPLKDLDTSKPDINEMVNRFLAWKLPSDFSPDCGISFQGNKSDKVGFNPIGTNLFTATQAKSMIEHMLSAAPTDTE